MRINQKKCLGCRICIPYCPMEAIRYTTEKKCQIDEDKCVECYVCLRSKMCPTAAFEVVPLGWPRVVRHIFSSPVKMQTVDSFDTGIAGRGTEEMKTNDVTERYNFGEIGFTVDIGRPGVGATFEEVEKIARSVAQVGVEFELMNPLTMLMVDRKTGKLREDVKKERVLSCILEFKIREDKLLSVIRALRDVAKRVDTVFSVGCISRVKSDGTIPVKAMLDRAQVFYRPNGKINVGLGKRKKKIF